MNVGLNLAEVAKSIPDSVMRIAVSQCLRFARKWFVSGKQGAGNFNAEPKLW